MFAQIQYIVSVTTGLILFGIGFFGFLDIPLELDPFWTVLLQPLGSYRWIDQYYFFALATLGFWLTLCIFVRIPAAIALSLVLGKVMMVGTELQIGLLLPVSLSISLYLLVFRMVTNPSFYHRGRDEIGKDIL